ncbi:outer membrane beta-barrel protein [uncultured Bacteroides sp.]|uniref:outer membrane beta-barrel protein n=1 Tax=uncultured Bacteroides sp. TaxID=162156 RepID=UPI0026247C6C|nr:outer membrane beta-barrel protein [uncultured Bacteroides sp.]
MNRKRFIISLILCILTLSCPVLAQDVKLTGKVTLIDASGKVQPLSYANISLLSLPDSVFIAGTVSHSDGLFELDGKRNPKTRYILKISYTGCLPVIRNIRSQADSISLGEIRLKEDAMQLNEIIVTASIKPVEQKKDTTIYNVAAYKIPQGSYLEALIRRVPGLIYNPKDHTISYNGHPITQIMVNGKEFFKGNNVIALENLPVTIIDKMKVYDRPTEEEEATGIRGNNKNFVIDLQTKRQINGSLMGAVSAGYGTKRKREFVGQLYKFDKGGNNMALTGNSGNKRFSTPYKKNNSNTINGNISKELKEGMNLSGYIGFSNLKRGSESSSRNERYLTDSKRFNVSEQDNWNKSNSINSHFNFNWKIDKKTSLFITNAINANASTSRGNSLSAGFNAKPQLSLQHPFFGIEEVDPSTRINRNEQQALTKMKAQTYNLQANITRRLNEKGSNISFSYIMTYSHYKSRIYDLSHITYYQLADQSGTDSVAFQNQYQYQPTRSFNNELKLAYTWAFSEKDHLQIAYTLKRMSEKQNMNTYNLHSILPSDALIGVLPDNYAECYNDSLSNHQSSGTTGHQFSLSYNHNGENWTFRTELNVQPQDRSLKQQSGTYLTDTTSFSVEWNPTLSVNYQKNEFNFNISYFGSTQQPSLTELLAPTDYRSPLYIRKSNPDLKPSYRHNLNISLETFSKGISGYISIGQEFNSITTASIYYPESGKVESRPTNINGNWNIMGNISYEKKFKQFSFEAICSGNYIHDVSLINETGGSMLQKSATRYTNLSSNIQLSYLPSWGNFYVIGSWDYNQSKNNLNDISTYNRCYTAELDASIHLPWHLQFDTNAKYNIQSGTGVSENDENEIIWDLKLSWRFLKNRQGELSLYWADILNQRKSITRTANSDGFYERYEKQLGSYILISLKYQLNTME